MCFEDGALECSERPQDANTADISPTAICAGRPEGLLPRVCFDPPPAGRQLGPTFDTSGSTTACDAVVSGVCVVVVAPAGITSGVFITGKRPVALWSADELVVSAIVDVSSHDFTGATTIGAGVDASLCPDVSAIDGTNGGGAGGSFGGAGGPGGNATSGGGGTPVPFANALTVRAGCRGGSGGSFGGTGGDSGGAVYLMARNTIAIDATINASGAGAFAAAANLGGGGGGSGGLIGLDAPTVNLFPSATLFAVGGGGGAGGGLSGNPGAKGDDPDCCPLAFALQAPPSSGNNLGGAGSDPVFGDAGGTGIDNAGGGGGGGGAGIIKVFASQFDKGQATIAPPAQ